MLQNFYWRYRRLFVLVWKDTLVRDQLITIGWPCNGHFWMSDFRIGLLFCSRYAHYLRCIRLHAPKGLDPGVISESESREPHVDSSLINQQSTWFMFLATSWSWHPNASYTTSIGLNVDSDHNDHPAISIRSSFAVLRVLKSLFASSQHHAQVVVLKGSKRRETSRDLTVRHQGNCDPDLMHKKNILNSMNQIRTVWRKIIIIGELRTAVALEFMNQIRQAHFICRVTYSVIVAVVVLRATLEDTVWFSIETVGIGAFTVIASTESHVSMSWFGMTDQL